MATQSQESKQANGLITLYIKLYQERHKRDPQLNRYKQKWGFQDMVLDLGYERAKEVVEYFFGLRKAEHNVQTLLFNYDKYAKTIAELKDDEADRLRLRAETAARVREWEENGNDGSRSS